MNDLGKTVSALALIASALILIGILIGINAPIRSSKRIDPELRIEIKDGQVDTTFIYWKK